MKIVITKFLAVFACMFHNFFTHAQDLSAKADLSGQTTQQSFFILDCVGASHGMMYMWEDNRNHLRQISRDIGFKHVRGHGLLDDDLSTYLNGQINMWNLHSIFDFLLSINVRPIFEVSFTPSELASNPNDSLMHYRANASPAKNLTVWTQFIHDLVQDLVDRYGIDEIRLWRFEFYNEPNCNFFHGTKQEWYDMYNATAIGIKSVDSLIQVGGPATCATGWIEEFLNYTSSLNVPADMVTSHLYPTDDVAAKTRDGFSNQVRQAALNVSKYGLSYVHTEFNAGLGMDTPINGDRPYTAAMVLHNHLALQGISNLDTLSFWSYSDLFEEGGMDSQPWHNGYGIMTVNGIPKPVYRMFEMLKALPSEAVPISITHMDDPKALIVNRSGSVSAGQVDLVVGVDKSLGNEVAVTALMNNFDVPGFAVTNKTIQLTFSGLQFSKISSTATLERIDSTHANAIEVWLQAGAPRYPSAAEIALELSASQLVPEDIQLSISSDGTSATVTVTMEPYSVARVRFSFLTK